MAPGRGAGSSRGTGERGCAGRGPGAAIRARVGGDPRVLDQVHDLKKIGPGKRLAAGDRDGHHAKASGGFDHLGDFLDVEGSLLVGQFGSPAIAAHLAAEVAVGCDPEQEEGQAARRASQCAT